VDYSDFFHWLREMEDDENERVRYDKGAENPLLRAVRDVIHRLLPSYSNLRIRRSGAMGDPRPRLTIEKDGQTLIFDALSEGERTLIVMVADIARRLAIAYPHAPNPLDQPCLLVIDELEQHLYPQWQRELPRRLRELFPGAQMILTTHSPIVVSELLPRHLRALQSFRLLEGAHREGQDVNEILEALFGTPSRRAETRKLIDAIREALDEDELDDAGRKLETLERQLGGDDPEVVRLTTIHRMLGAIDHDAVSEG
jgi:predicted ATP-binding protein involved in virulence